MEKLAELFYDSSGVCTDTRNIKKDSLFIALKGANFNGNSFAKEAIRIGAKYAIVDEKNMQTIKTFFMFPTHWYFFKNLRIITENNFVFMLLELPEATAKQLLKN